jgi:spore coat polysaccharide biosynthesis protein SpsF
MGLTASIQVRLGSTRLPGKVLYHLGPKRVIQWVVSRCQKASTIDNVVVAIGDKPENDAIRQWCERHDVDYTTGPEENLLERHRQVSLSLDGADSLVRVTGDCPFLPPDEIDRVVHEHLNSDNEYTTNVTEEMPIGTAVDVIDVSLLEVLHKRGETHPVKVLREHPGEWAISMTSANPWRQHPGVHIAVDTPTDYWRLVDAYNAVNGDPQDVLSWLAEQ